VTHGKSTNKLQKGPQTWLAAHKTDTDLVSPSNCINRSESCGSFVFTSLWLHKDATIHPYISL